jgi:pimeloyl-ACP methyl ester carboxylesterase
MTGAVRRAAVGLIAALTLAAPGAAQAFSLTVTGPADAPRMVFTHPFDISSVCLPVTNPAGGRSVLYGQRFAQGPVTAATPVIVLVHGIASNTVDWDYSPTWSVARALASAGYVVFTYDRLGYDKSSYLDHPGGGETLTTAAHRAMLHDVVGDVKSGAYGVTATAGCPASVTPAGGSAQKVVVIGHSAGGWVVSGYPGQYHDVAAMVEADISGSAGGSAAAPLGGSSQGGSFTPDPAHPDYFQFFQTAQECEEFDNYAPGEVGYVAKIACTPPFLDSPFAEIQDLGAKYAENDAEIAQIGPTIPVLLTSGEQDTTDPPASATADLAYYKAHCGCDVSQLLLPNTGHLFMAHRSLPEWVDHVVNWLGAHAVSGTPAAGGTTPPAGGTSPPAARCPAPTGGLSTRSLGPLTVGWTRVRARRTLLRFTVSRRNMDRFCLTPGGPIRAGYPSATLLRTLSASGRAKITGRVVLLLTANRHYALRGVRPGARVSRIAKRLHLAKPFQIGLNRWYVTAGSGVLKVRRGVVEEIGIASRQLLHGRAAQRRLLRSFTGA